MNLIIDTNVALKVFNREENFRIIFDCISNPKSCGKMVYGGTKFLKELLPIIKQFSSLLNELNRSGRVIILNKKEVDKLCLELKRIEPSKDFDDEHIIACVIIAKCALVITDDKRSDRFIKDERKNLYPTPKYKPKIFRYSAKHSNLVKPCLQ